MNSNVELFFRINLFGRRFVLKYQLQSWILQHCALHPVVLLLRLLMRECQSLLQHTFSKFQILGLCHQTIIVKVIELILELIQKAIKRFRFACQLSIKVCVICVSN